MRTATLALALAFTATLAGCPEDPPATTPDTSTPETTTTPDGGGETTTTPDAVPDGSEPDGAGPDATTPDAVADSVEDTTTADTGGDGTTADAEADAVPDAAADAQGDADTASEVSGDAAPTDAVGDGVAADTTTGDADASDAAGDTPLSDAQPDAVADANDDATSDASTPDAAADAQPDVIVGTAGSCAAPEILTEDVPASGNTAAGQDNLTAVSGLGTCQEGGSPESVFSFTPAASGFATFTLTSATDQGLYVRTECEAGATEIACADNELGGTDEVQGVMVLGGQTYWVIVDGYSAGEEGPFTLSVSVLGESDCTDGVDNNGDGEFTDCADPSCFDDAACTSGVTAACSAAEALTPGSSQTGDTADGTTFFSPVNPACIASGGANVVPYTYTPSGNELLGVQLSAATDMGMFVRSTCDDPASQVICWDAAFAGDDEVVVLPLAAGQQHTIFVAPYDSQEGGTYSLESVAVSNAETEPNETFGEADPIASGDYGHLTDPGDVDWFSFTLDNDAASVTISTGDVVAGDCANSRVDTDLGLYASDGTTEIAFNDDVDEANDNYCSELTATNLTAGDYLIRVRASVSFCAGCFNMGYGITIDVQ